MSASLDVSHQLDVLRRGAAEIIPEEELERKLARSVEHSRPLRVKLGIDPSTPDLHLGHAVVLGVLRRFQDLGHTAVLIVGDFTGRVGDPAGQSETRPLLTPEELEANARTYLDQAGKVLDVGRAEVRRNSEWLAGLTFADVARLASTLTVARLLERDDFSARFREGRAISLTELLYPLMQGFDSVATRADVELGGTDQTFNLLVGRDIQRAHVQEPQVAFTMPLLTGTDGDRKMSKSFGNHVGLTDPPEEQFGKTMSIPDHLLSEWFRLCTGLHPEELEGIDRGLADRSLHPAEQKRRLAREIVTRYHGAEAAGAAEKRFDRIHREHEVPNDIPEFAIPSHLKSVTIARLIADAGLAESRSDARRLISQQGVRIAGEPFLDIHGDLPREELIGKVLQVGRRRFVRLRDA
jgi:tyrosyl-tRNA synthetase